MTTNATRYGLKFRNELLGPTRAGALYADATRLILARRTGGRRSSDGAAPIGKDAAGGVALTAWLRQHTKRESAAAPMPPAPMVAIGHLVPPRSHKLWPGGGVRAIWHPLRRISYRLEIARMLCMTSSGIWYPCARTAQEGGDG